jgi:hypothetical protein
MIMFFNLGNFSRCQRGSSGICFGSSSGLLPEHPHNVSSSTRIIPIILDVWTSTAIVQMWDSSRWIRHYSLKVLSFSLLHRYWKTNPATTSCHCSKVGHLSCCIFHLINFFLELFLSSLSPSPGLISPS